MNPVDPLSAGTADILVETRLLDDRELEISWHDRQTLRDLAAQVRQLADRPVEAEKQDLWRRHNRLEATRPPVFCDPEDGWDEILPPETLTCSTQVARQWELELRKQVFYGLQLQDDTTIRPCFDLPHLHTLPDWGLKETQIGGENHSAARWESPVKSEADIEKLHPPRIQVDFRGTRLLAALAKETFGDLLDVRVRTRWWWSVGMTKYLAYLRGLEQMMVDMIDDPRLLHRLMGVLRDGTLAMITCLEREGLLAPNWDGAFVGSGGLGWSDELPQADFAGTPRLEDLWGNSESQETVAISPRMFAEFIFPYQLPLTERFGLNCYGCCEPLDNRWEIIRQIPRLRRISVSPWSDRAKMASRLEDRYIFSMKPNPAELAEDVLDEERVRQNLRRDLALASGCRVEIVMKDNHTIRSDPARLTRWVQIAREEADRFQA